MSLIYQGLRSNNGNVIQEGYGRFQSEKIAQERKQIVEAWERTNLLKGLEGRMKDNMAQLYENTAYWMLNESTLTEATSTNSAGPFETIAFPLIRRTFTKLLSNDIVTVHALNYTIGKLFFFRPLISNRDSNGDHSSRQGAYSNQPIWSGTTNTASQNSYALNQFADAPNFNPNREQGPTLYDQNFATEYHQFGESLFDRSKPNYVLRQTTLSGGTINPTDQIVNVIITGFSNTNQAGTIVGPSGVEIDTEEFLASLEVKCTQNLTSIESNSTILSGNAITTSLRPIQYGAQMVDPQTGTIRMQLVLSVPSSNGGYEPFAEVKDGTVNSVTQFYAEWKEYQINENDSEMAEVTFDLSEVTISVGKARKMRSNWTPELGMDVQRYQNIDAEAELTNLLSETVANEIDTENLKNLIAIAPWQVRWDYNGLRRPGSSQYYGTQKDWNQTLIERINQIDAQIHKSTFDGGANYIVVSPEVAALFRNLEYFHIDRPGQGADEVEYAMGVEKVGSLENRYTVYMNTKMPAGLILVGRVSDSPMKAGYVYAPYQPITMTPSMVDPETFTNVKGLMTRYATKTIFSRYYGKIFIDGLPTFSVGDLR